MTYFSIKVSVFIYIFIYIYITQYYRQNIEQQLIFLKQDLSIHESNNGTIRNKHN